MTAAKPNWDALNARAAELFARTDAAVASGDAYFRVSEPRKSRNNAAKSPGLVLLLVLVPALCAACADPLQDESP